MLTYTDAHSGLGHQKFIQAFAEQHCMRQYAFVNKKLASETIKSTAQVSNVDQLSLWGTVLYVYYLR